MYFPFTKQSRNDNIPDIFGLHNAPRPPTDFSQKSLEDLMTELSRRSFFSRAALLTVGSGLCAGTFNLEAIAAAPKTARSLAEVLAMSDVEMARQSAGCRQPTASSSMRPASFEMKHCVKKTLSILDNPRPHDCARRREGDPVRAQARKTDRRLLCLGFPPDQDPQAKSPAVLERIGLRLLLSSRLSRRPRRSLRRSTSFLL